MSCLTLGPLVFESPAMLLFFAMLIGSIVAWLVAGKLRPKCVHHVMALEKEMLKDFLKTEEGKELLDQYVKGIGWSKIP